MERPRCCSLAIATQDNPIFEGKELVCDTCGRTWFYHNVGGWKTDPVSEPPDPVAAERQEFLEHIDKCDLEARMEEASEAGAVDGWCDCTCHGGQIGFRYCVHCAPTIRRLPEPEAVRAAAEEIVTGIEAEREPLQ